LAEPLPRDTDPVSYAVDNAYYYASTLKKNEKLLKRKLKGSIEVVYDSRLRGLIYPDNGGAQQGLHYAG
jgi:hypothetical protein